jgi:hypothetical protein
MGIYLAFYLTSWGHHLAKLNIHLELNADINLPGVSSTLVKG